MNEEIIHKAFEVSPTTIYGLLVGLLVVTVIFLVSQLVGLQRSLIELNKETIQSLADAVNAIERIHVEVKEMKDSMLEKLLK